MEIVISGDKTVEHKNLGTYRYITVVANGLEVIVLLASGGLRTYCSVSVMNASRKAWWGRGGSLGREFSTLDAARAAYRDKRVLAALEAVAAVVNPSPAVAA